MALLEPMVNRFSSYRFNLAFNPAVIAAAPGAFSVA